MKEFIQKLKNSNIEYYFNINSVLFINTPLLKNFKVEDQTDMIYAIEKLKL